MKKRRVIVIDGTDQSPHAFPPEWKKGGKGEPPMMIEATLVDKDGEPLAKRPPFRANLRRKLDKSE